MQEKRMPVPVEVKTKPDNLSGGDAEEKYLHPSKKKSFLSGTD